MNYKNIFLSLISLLILLCGQSYTQWQRVNLPYDIKVNTVRAKDSIIFVSTDGEGIYVSTDNGENWNNRNEGLQSKFVHEIFIDGSTVYAGTETGASISLDDGITWDTINTGLSGKGVWSFAAGNSTFGIPAIYAGTWSGIYFSTNNGANWEVTGLSSTTMPIHSILIRDNYIFAATFAGGIFNSQSFGMTWKDITIDSSNNFQESVIPVYSLALFDTNIVAGTSLGRIFRTSYKDSNFTNVFSFTASEISILSFVVYNKSLFSGNSRGDVYSSINGGLKWKIVYPSITKEAVYSLALNKSYMFAVTPSGVWRLWYPEKNTTITDTDLNNNEDAAAGFELKQNYPNPFNSSTKIKFTIPGNSRVTLKVYNILGKLVDEVVDQYMSSGTYQVEFSPGNLPSGIYFYSLITNEFSSTKKLILLK